MRKAVRRASRAALLAALLAVSPRASSADDRGPLVEPRLGPLVHRTVERASKRLAAPGCAMLLDDFPGVRSGQALSATLSTHGRAPSELFASLLRRRGPHDPVPGAEDVRLAPRRRRRRLRLREPVPLARAEGRVARRERPRPGGASLGLGEAPPSSEEITAAVVRRCGR